LIFRLVVLDLTYRKGNISIFRVEPSIRFYVDKIILNAIYKAILVLNLNLDTAIEKDWGI
jgi:hypothetical protein